MLEQYRWWQKGIIYQIYPRSYQDSNNDGIGDLGGIRERLDYVKSLNVNTIWISPFYPSPMYDFGYDVADYTGIHPIFGSMEDFEALLEAVHQREMKLIVDLVPNHTSSQHPWFIESRSSRDNPKRNWYIWRDPAPDGTPPNNWISHFSGPAWTFDEHTGQYYLHQFHREQPELNYRNPEVLHAMLDVMRFWLDKGVDGFRVDVIWLLIKDEELRNEPLNPDWEGFNPHTRFLRVHSADQPEVHDVIKQMRAVVDSYGDRVMIGEIYLPIPKLVHYYGEEMDECHMPYNFHLITTADWNPASIRETIRQYEEALPEEGWPNWVLGNHDQPRIASRVGQEQARVANMLLLTLRGTPTTYYGEEIGMENVPIPKDMLHDPPALAQPDMAHIVGRDPERTPMQWDDSANAGFASPESATWLPVAEDYLTHNVAQQEKDPTSMLNLYRALTGLRQREPALCVGDYAPVEVTPDVHDVFAYVRQAEEGDRFLVTLNFGRGHYHLDLSRVARRATIEVDTGMRRNGEVNLAELELHPNEGLVLRLDAAG